MNVLVIAAHPDDEVLGCGGTMARLAREGHTVYVAILGEGITSRFQERDAADSALLEELHSHCPEAMAILGVEEPFLYSLPDNRFDTLPLLDVVKIVEELIEKTLPEVIYTHHGSDLNVDHQVVHRAVLTATRPIGEGAVREVYTFEVLSSSEWGFHHSADRFRPQVFTDVSETLDLKCAAMEVYESEARDFPHPRSPEAIRALAKRRGSTAGFAAAEAFELVRALRPRKK